MTIFCPVNEETHADVYKLVTEVDTMGLPTRLQR